MKNTFAHFLWKMRNFVWGLFIKNFYNFYKNMDVYLLNHLNWACFTLYIFITCIHFLYFYKNVCPQKITASPQLMNIFPEVHKKWGIFLRRGFRRCALVTGVTGESTKLPEKSFRTPSWKLGNFARYGFPRKVSPFL